MSINMITVVLLAVFILGALIIYLASDSKNPEKWTSFSFAVSVMGGFFIYGALNSVNRTSGIIGAIQTVIDIGKMFAGNSRLEDFVDFVGAENEHLLWWLLFFWAIHFLAYYAAVSAVLLLLGQGLLRRLRLFLFRVRDVELILGADEDTVAYGSQLASDKHVYVIFVGNEENTDVQIRQMGAVLYSDESAMKPTLEFLKRLPVKKGRGSVHLSAISGDLNWNMEYALRLLDCLQTAGIDPSQCSLTLFSAEEVNGDALLDSEDHYGYSIVREFNRSELVSRLLMQRYPMCDSIAFAENGRAKENMEALLIGFGETGRELLKKMVANGQFEGSHFHVQVFDPQCGVADGIFRRQFSPMLEAYDITFAPYDGRSPEFADYLAQKATDLKYIVVSVGDCGPGEEIVRGILDVLRNSGNSIPVYECRHKRLIAYHSKGITQEHSVYTPDILCTGKLDVLAVECNHRYCGEDGVAREQWNRCDYFSRMSNRASVDYLAPLLAHTKALEQESIADDLLENLAKSEHLRWCAFHYSMGYRPMGESVLKARAEEFREDKRLRISKDVKGKTHACMIPWEELDDLSEFESSVTGKAIDYKQLDRNNILVHEKIYRESSINNNDLTPQKRKRLPVPVFLIILAALTGAAFCGLSMYKEYRKENMSFVPGVIVLPDETHVSEAPEDISYTRARYMLGDSTSEKFIPSDEEPPSAYPYSYDSKKLYPFLVNCYPPTRSQGHYGTCWAHSAVAAAELSMIYQGYADKNVDYSELHLAYYAYNKGSNGPMGDNGDAVNFTDDTDNFLEHGACSYYPVLTLGMRKGVVSEKLLSYGKAEDVLKNGIPQSEAFSNSATLKNAMFIDIKANAKQLKQAICENGSAYAHMHYDSGNKSTYYNKKTNAWYVNDDDVVPNHAVVIVGWDDDFPRENFVKMPNRDGAWLIRNSWSNETEMSIYSYFWISYEDAGINYSPAIILEMEPAYDAAKENVYTYTTQACRMGPGRTSAANVFTACGSGGINQEIIKSVMFCAQKSGDGECGYTVQIKRGITQGTNPAESGTIVSEATMTGKIYYDGFYTVELENPVCLEKGETYAVIVILDGGKVSRELRNGTFTVPACHSGESYVVSDGVWTDYGSTRTGSNFLIGAVTVEKQSDMTQTLTIPDNVKISINNANDVVTVTWDPVDGAEGYQYRFYSDDELLKESEKEKNELKLTNPKFGVVYTFYIRSFKRNENGEDIVSDWKGWQFTL